MKPIQPAEGTFNDPPVRLGCLWGIAFWQVAQRTTPLENLKALRELLDRPELAEHQRDFLPVSDRAMLDPEVIVATRRNRSVG